MNNKSYYASECPVKTGRLLTTLYFGSSSYELDKATEVYLVTLLCARPCSRYDASIRRCVIAFLNVPLVKRKRILNLYACC